MVKSTYESVPTDMITQPSEIKLLKAQKIEVETAINAVDQEIKQFHQSKLEIPFSEHWIIDLKIAMLENGVGDWPNFGLEMTGPSKAELQKRHRHIIYQIRAASGLHVTPSPIGDDQIREAKLVPIQDLFGDKLRKVGHKLWGRCPFHDEKTASFCIYVDQNSWWCYSCNEGGSVVDYIMKKHKVRFIEAIKYLLKYG